MVYKFRKQIRLGHDIYKDECNICSITICAENRRPIFLQDKFTKECVAFIYEYSRRFNIPFYIFKFLPDHLHLLLSSSGLKSIIDIVQELKGQITRIAWKHELRGRVWQKSFYDHFLRKEEAVKTVVKYILDNARRKGLVKDWTEYPYIGSTVYSIDDFKNL